MQKHVALGPVTQVASGDGHTCALRTNGTVACWGNNVYGQVGNGTTGAWQLAPVTVTGLTNATSISTSGSHTCALRSDGTVVCWGSGNMGELGNGTLADSPTPVTVTGLTTATSVTAGSSIGTCATRADGSVACWGSWQSTPATVTGVTNASSVSAGANHACALSFDGSRLASGEYLYVARTPDGSRARRMVLLK